MTAPSLQSQFKTLSIIIPVYNEKATIQRVIATVMAAPLPLGRELIIVDDFSRDGTREILQALAAPPGTIIKVLLHDRNRGKGAAMRTGLEQVSGEIVVVQDADLEYHPADLPKLLEPILTGRARAPDRCTSATSSSTHRPTTAPGWARGRASPAPPSSRSRSPSSSWPPAAR